MTEKPIRKVSSITERPGAEAGGGFLQAGTRSLRLEAPSLKGVVAEYVVTDDSETATTDVNTSASKRARLTRGQDADSNVPLAGTLYIVSISQLRQVKKE